jgi:hypothetical protein
MNPEPVQRHSFALYRLRCSLVDLALPVWAQARRKVTINEDLSGACGSNMQALLVLAQYPQMDAWELDNEASARRAWVSRVLLE